MRQNNPFWSLLFMAAVAVVIAFLSPDSESKCAFGVAIGLAFSALFGRLGIDDSSDYEVRP